MHNLVPQMLKLAHLSREIPKSPVLKTSGRITSINGPLLIAKIPHAAIGDVCEVTARNKTIKAQVVAFNEDDISLAPFEYFEGLSPGALVRNTAKPLTIQFDDSRLGQILDALGNNLQTRQTSQQLEAQLIEIPLQSPPPNPLDRKPIYESLVTGIRSLDGLCPLGHGQRLGLFAGAGVGKSTLLGSIARNAEIDVSVIALVGERGREVNEFIEHSLGESGLKKSVVVVATSDETSLKRMLAPQTATAIAEHFRNQGKRVLLMVDSLTRAARAIREVSLAAGELPVRQGYTSSVFTELPRLLERAGTNRSGCITAIYTVLVGGNENESDPLAEEVKSILDGHLVLNNYMIQQGIRPAIDPTLSISRLVSQLRSQSDLTAITKVMQALSRLKRDKDILLLGGTPDEELKRFLEQESALKEFLNQSTIESSELAYTLSQLSNLSNSLIRGE